MKDQLSPWERWPRLGWRTGESRGRTVRRDGRLVIVQVLVLALMATLLVRAAWMQLGSDDRYVNAAVANSVREVPVAAQRGLILDQAGRPIVGNRSTLTVTVDRYELDRSKDGGKDQLSRLAERLGTTYDHLVDRMKPCGTPGAPAQPVCWNGPREQPVVVADDVPQELGLQLMEQANQFPAISAELRPTRAYPKTFGATAEHVVGYLGQLTEEEMRERGIDASTAAVTVTGRAGLEQQYDQYLAGQAGLKRVSVSRSGAVTNVLRDDPAQPGSNLVTTIDARLQGVVEKQAKLAYQRARTAGRPADSGAIIVQDVTNGDVLAMTSFPRFDPEVWIGGISQANYDKLTSEKNSQPLLNRALQGLYAPASTFKIITTAAAVKAGYSMGASYPCPSAYAVGGRSFSNYESRAYGSISLAKALSVSCDTVYYKFAHDMWLKDGGLNPTGTPAEHILNTARSFGLGQATGIDLPGEYAGRLPGREYRKAFYEEMKDTYCARAKNGYPEETPDRNRLLTSYAKEFCIDGDKLRGGDALNFAIGQGDTMVTPLQVDLAYSALANGGTLYRPRVAKAVIAQDGTVEETFDTEVIGQLDVDPAVLSYMTEALVDTSRNGTMSGALAGFPLREIPIASKTGTAEVEGKVSTAWVSSFAPANNPRYTVTCVVAQGGTGSETCGPSVRAIYEAIFGVKGSVVDPSKSVFAGGQPNSALPDVAADGLRAPQRDPVPAESGEPARPVPSPSTQTPTTQNPTARPTPMSGGQLVQEPSPAPEQSGASRSGVLGIVREDGAGG